MSRSLTNTIRAIKAQALREAAAALEDIDPDDVHEWLSERADAIESAPYTEQETTK